MSLAGVERYLLGERAAELPTAAVLEHGLAGLAAERSPEALPAQLVAARAVAKREHERNRALVVGLLAAWAQAGIDTLLFKGFALAEFVYPDAAWRPYSDVDAAIDERHLEAAHEAVSRLGWRVLWRAGESADAWSHHGDEYCGHELMLLEHPSGLSLDLHRRLLHNNDNRVPRFAHQERITRAVWEAAEPADLDGVEVMLPSREDMALVGLVLNRYWSGDRYELRATDYLDLQRLMGLAPAGARDAAAERVARERLAGLERRAAELGCRHTLRAFLRRCDPFRGAVALRPPSALERASLDLELAPEHGHRQLARLPRDAGETVRLALGAARELPAVYQARRELAAGRGSVSGMPAEGGRPLTHGLWRSRRDSVRAAVKLLTGGRRAAVDRDLLALAVARSLRRSGVPITLEAQGSGAAEERSEAPTPPVLRLAGRRLPLDG